MRRENKGPAAPRPIRSRWAPRLLTGTWAVPAGRSVR